MQNSDRLTDREQSYSCWGWVVLGEILVGLNKKGKKRRGKNSWTQIESVVIGHPFQGWKGVVRGARR